MCSLLFRYALRRRTFGKTLIEHPVIRAKVGEMARQIESTHAMLELLTYQMTKMPKKEQMTKLAADSALIKVQVRQAWLLSHSHFLREASAHQELRKRSA